MTVARTLQGRLTAVVLPLLIGTALNAWLSILVRTEGTVRVTLACTGRYCVATLNGGQPLAVEDKSPIQEGKIGLYAFAPREATRGRVCFSDLHLRAPRSGSPDNARAISLKRPEDLEELHANDGWSIRRWAGLRFLGVPGSRDVALLRGATPSDFVLDVTLRDATDAGILFRASDRRNGLVLVARPPLNDAFFFRLVDGEPGPILGLAPLKNLRVDDELLRLLHLVLNLAVWAGWFLVLLWTIATLVPARPMRMAGRIWGKCLARPLVLPIVLGLLSFSVLAAVAWFAYDGIPHIEDEKVNLFQARIFAAGRLWAPAPPIPEFFEHWHVIMSEGRWFGKYPPLFSAILALGVRAGVYWLVNPILGAVTIVCMFFLARSLRGPSCGVLACMLAVTSPFFLVMGAGMMGHMSSTALLWLAAVFGLRAMKNDARLNGFIAGACGGMVLLIRPYTAILFLFALCLYLAFRWPVGRRRQDGMKALACFVVGFLPLLILTVGWNYAYIQGAGAPLGLHELYDKTDTLGFGPSKGVGQRIAWGSWGHTPAKAVRSIWHYLDHTSHYLMGWPGRLSLALVFAPFLFGIRRRRYWLFAALFLVLVIGHFFYWATEHIGVGARYWFEGLPGIFVLSAAGLVALAGRGDDSADGGAPLTWRQGAIALVVAGLIGWNLYSYLPRTLGDLHRLNDITADLKREVDSRGLTNAVVFIKTQGLYGNDGFYLNDPFLKTGPVFARDLGPRNGDLLRCFPGYKGYTWDKKVLRSLPSAVPGVVPAESETGVKR